ncbi:plexin domain-containing protein 1-like [Diretmus argenteus]
MDIDEPCLVFMTKFNLFDLFPRKRELLRPVSHPNANATPTAQQANPEPSPEHEELDHSETPGPVPLHDLENNLEKQLHEEIYNLRKERDEARKERDALTRQVQLLKFSANSVRDDDTACKTMTGLSWTLFESLHQFLITYLSKGWGGRASDVHIVRKSGFLSKDYHHSGDQRVALSFDFPFYGHYLRQITIATGGFIFMGDVTHRMLTATQYIAPLMANFDPSYSKDSTVQYLDNGEVFVVQWEQVRLKGKESEGAFTFQAALYKTGAVTFSYRDIPLSVEVISSPEHPVKAGLSDAFMVMSSPESPDAQQRTIYEYNRVAIDTTKITNHSAFEFTALPTCLQRDSCELCLSSNQTSGCSWCNVLQRCSDGMDRHRQEWLDYACAEESKDVTCEDYSRGGPDSSIDPSVTSDFEAVTPLTPVQKGCEIDDQKTDSPRQSTTLANTGIIAGVVAALVLLLALLLLALYINYHPTAASPLYLIQRRKNYWPSLKFQKQGFQSGYTEVEGEGHEKESIVEAGPC